LWKTQSREREIKRENQAMKGHIPVGTVGGCTTESWYFLRRRLPDLKCHLLNNIFKNS
jgi:hypothetical protein